MPIEKLKKLIDKIDIYLLDQILKNRYLVNEKILDVGCGNGRNLKWFYNNNYTIHGVDTDAKKIEEIKNRYPNQSKNFSISKAESLSFENETFHHIICNAVLHFAKSDTHFYGMFSELIGVLKPNGTLFIRMTSNFGIEDKIIPIKNGVYKLPDGTERFLFTKSILNTIKNNYDLRFLEPIKTVNVEDKRCMTTLMLQKC
jgi:2-polyprenyl-3-methyl-5-hydroxy-6-metoxy-1,4-benzoquinol methylase